MNQLRKYAIHSTAIKMMTVVEPSTLVAKPTSSARLPITTTNRNKPYDHAAIVTLKSSQTSGQFGALRASERRCWLSLRLIGGFLGSQGIRGAYRGTGASVNRRKNHGKAS